MNRAERRRQRKKSRKAEINGVPEELEDRSSEQQMNVLQQALDLAMQHHSAGELPKAEGIYQKMLLANPNHPDALHLLGVLAHQTGKNDIAAGLIRKTIAIKPDYAEPHSNLGNALRGLGQLDEAVASYHRALSIKPNYTEVHNNLSVALQELGKLEEAVESCNKALAIKPDYVEAHYNLGNVLKELGQLEEAVASYHNVLAIKPDYAEANYNLGNALQELGQLDEAVASYHKTLVVKPDYAKAHNNLGNVLQDLGKLEEALTSYNKAIAINSDYAEAHSNVGNVLKALGKLDEAVDSYRKALTIKPDYSEAYNNLGVVLQDLGRLNEAIENCRKSLAIKPDYAEAYSNLGLALQSLGRLDEAVASHHTSLSIRPNGAEAYNNLGNTLKDLGKLDEALASYQKAIAIKPDYVEAGKNLLFTLLCVPELFPEELFNENICFSENLTRGIVLPAKDVENDPTPDRRLRVGYLSSDFRNHPVGSNILPLLSSHDRVKFEVFCYADVIRPDEITKKIRSSVDHWQTIVGKSDSEVAKMVRTDGIDVLVCLAGHFDSNRPLICAHRAAPVQVSYLDGPTSGLKQMDYLLTDDYLNPLDTKEMFTEELYRLPVYQQYPPTEGAPPVAALPSAQAGVITFGSFNNPAKVNAEVIRLWAKILTSVPGSRLLLKYKNWYGQVSLHDRLRDRFSACGIDQDRVLFAASPDTFYDHLCRYSDVDISLDPFPLNGVTTTFQALWMGVPVVSLAGETFCSRAAGAILHNLDLGDLAVETPEAYVECARDLAGDLARLEALRATLREQIATSPLCDATTYARSVETAYREMWHKWCAGQHPIT